MGVVSAAQGQAAAGAAGIAPSSVPVIVPVVDLMGGALVRAQRGERHRYAPWSSPLGDGGRDPLGLADALARRAGSDTLYVADLDALQGGAAQLDLLRALFGFSVLVSQQNATDERVIAGCRVLERKVVGERRGQGQGYETRETKPDNLRNADSQRSLATEVA